MTTLLDLYEYAEDQGIDVDWVPLEQATSLSIQMCIRDRDYTPPAGTR